MIIEKKKIEKRGNGNGIYGHITLDKLAICETVKITLSETGEEIYPESFDYLGHPNFTEEQTKLFMFMENERERKIGEYVSLEAEITYEERIFNVSRENFDSIGGIKKSLVNLSMFNEMIDNRNLFFRIRGKRLNEFVIFGCIKLDYCGRVIFIKQDKEPVYTEVVEKFLTFKRNNNDFNLCNNVIVPKPNSICPCCGKLITISDIKDNPCVYVNEKFYHDKCYCNYKKICEIDEFTRRIMDLVYKYTDYKFTLLSNEYCKKNSIPWFMFHTIDGDIKIGRKERVIFIEWQENYKPFDINEVFCEEDVTKWKENCKCGIYAWDFNQAFKYLKKVRNVVNPNYLK